MTDQNEDRSVEVTFLLSILFAMAIGGIITFMLFMKATNQTNATKTVNANAEKVAATSKKNPPKASPKKSVSPSSPPETNQTVDNEVDNQTLSDSSVSSDTSDSTAEVDAPEGTLRIKGESRIGCLSEQRFDRLLKFAAQNDSEAFKSELLAGVATGDCTLFKENEPVYQTEGNPLSGRAKLRRPGETIEYWAIFEAAQ